MPGITTSTLECGAMLAVEKIIGVQSVGVRILVPAGDAHDPENALGRSTMWSELLQRGAGDLDSRAQADAFDLLGASRDVSNGRLYMKLSSTMLADRLHDTLPLLTDTLLRPRFDESSVEPTRELCLQALASLADDPQHRCTLAARDRHYPSPLNRSGYGTESGLRALDRDALADGWRDSALPAGSIITVAGAVEPDAVRDRLNDLLGGWSGTADVPASGPDAPRGYAHIEDDTEQVQIILVHDAPREPSDDVYLETLLIGVLSGGMSSRLFSEVREKRALCYSVNASYSASKEAGTVTAYVGTAPDRAQESLDVLCAELERINGGSPVTPAEFGRAKNGIKSRIVFSGESTGARASALASDLHNHGRARGLDEITERIDAITLDELNAYASKRTLGRLTIQTLGPEPLKPPAG